MPWHPERSEGEFRDEQRNRQRPRRRYQNGFRTAFTYGSRHYCVVAKSIENRTAAVGIQTPLNVNEIYDFTNERLFFAVILIKFQNHEILQESAA